MDSAIQDRLNSEIRENRIVVYMRGTPEFPQCGFSARVVQILREIGADEFHAVDLIVDPVLREAVKTFSNWPEIPQVYMDGEFLGGCDILTELLQSGELKQKAVQSIADPPAAGAYG